MSSPVKSVATAVVHQASEFATKKAKEAVKAGVAATKSSVESMASDAVESATAFVRVKSAISSIIYILGYAIKVVYYRLFYCRNIPSESESRLASLKGKLEKLDSLSGEAALKEAENADFIAFYGTQMKPSYKMFTTANAYGQSLIDVMRASADTNRGKELIPALKLYYQLQYPQSPAP